MRLVGNEANMDVLEAKIDTFSYKGYMLSNIK